MKDEVKILATRCGSCNCGCPTIMEVGGDTVVIVGSATDAFLQAVQVKERTGVGEAAVAIPKSLLLEALRALQA